MANNERLTKRVKQIEKWLEENGGGDTLSNMNFVLDMFRNASNHAQNVEKQFNMQRQLLSEYLEQKELVDDWDGWLQEKDANALQEQQAEEVSVEEEAKSGEETSETPKEEE